MNFMNALNNELNNEKQLTENGAIGYSTTGKKLLDLNFSVSSLRNATEKEILNKFMDAYWENPSLAIKWLFYSRDIRGGLGERRLFRLVINHLAKRNPNIVKNLIKYIPKYGRYDDLLCLLDTSLRKEIISFISSQLSKDNIAMRNNESISLLTKWLPSENSSSSTTKAYAKIIREGLKMTPRNYRKMLSKMRYYIDVVECKMSAKEWGEIDYATVPSRANLLYNNAFLRNDKERREEYLSLLSRGETKINASVLYPHEIVSKYTNNYDSTLENLWKSLPNKVKGCNNTIVVADGSGSMSWVNNNSNIIPLNVANALAIYFSERSSGQFKNKYITFSLKPQLVDFSNAITLKDKIEIALRHCENANTNIEAVFDLILSTAIKNNMSQSDIPANILIISDMEFDSCAYSNNRYHADLTLFNAIEKKYAAAGYKLPRLVFWNICSRTNTIPVKENKLGVALVSGFSVNIVDMVMSNKLDPYECLIEALNKYEDVYIAIKDMIEKS